MEWGVGDEVNTILLAKSTPTKYHNHRPNVTKWEKRT